MKISKNKSIKKHLFEQMFFESFHPNRMFINFALWSDNDGVLWLAIALTLISCIVAVSSANKEEKTN